jgi:hypothetical protein
MAVRSDMVDCSPGGVRAKACRCVRTRVRCWLRPRCKEYQELLQVAQTIRRLFHVHSPRRLQSHAHVVDISDPFLQFQDTIHHASGWEALVYSRSGVTSRHAFLDASCGAQYANLLERHESSYL